MNPKDKATLGIVQSVIVAGIGLIIGLFPQSMIRRLPGWFGWILFVLGILGILFYLRRHQKTRGPWV